MKYVFTAEFLKITPPETSFADAWEALCADLLRHDLNDEECICLKAPDRGVDIFLRKKKKAIQCKSDERGAYGTVPPAPSIESMTTAMKHKTGLGWHSYVFATNADYSGNGVEQILLAADNLGLDRDSVIFYGPKHWSDLCEKYIEHVKYRLDYRLLFSENDVIEAFNKANYYENKVREYSQLIKQGAYSLKIANNRTPILLEIPFSQELTIEHCLNVSMQLLGISLKSQEFPDLGTSAKPSVSITIDKIPQNFNKRLGDFSQDELSKLTVWIKVIWKEIQDNDTSENLYLKTRLEYTCKLPKTISATERRDQTLARFEAHIQKNMWNSIAVRAGKSSGQCDPM